METKKMSEIEWNGRVRKVGTGWVISIPKIVIEEAGLKEGDIVNCSINAKIEFVKKPLEKE